ncbi:MAG: winged helix-turn-helix domain-containing protein, partial [Actinomycetota bacterium]|nr:winged helix-turn-helix domain-containing protein [Actinomycetota bacterium]
MNADTVVVLRAASRELRRSLRPIEWVVLEDVALDARPDDDGVLVASTSAREVAEHLGLTPGAVARALAHLRSAGLVTHARQIGPAGRFGLSAYVLGPVPGLEVFHAAGAPPVLLPRAARPRIESPCAADRHMAGTEPGVDAPGLTGPDPDRSPVRGNAAGLPAKA